MLIFLLPLLLFNISQMNSTKEVIEELEERREERKYCKHSAPYIDCPSFTDCILNGSDGTCVDWGGNGCINFEEVDKNKIGDKNG